MITTHSIKTKPTQPEVEFPTLVRIRQRFSRPRLVDIEGAVQAELAACSARLPEGGRIAIAVGSRGIANLASIVRATCTWVRAQGCQPFIIPAMGSHGGATAEGQRAILEDYGVSQASTGAPVLSSMEVVELPNPGVPVPLYFDRRAFEADGVIVINRIKPHTDFHGPYESGLVKMIVIGLGKQTQALAIHKYGVRGLRDFISLAAQAVIDQGRILLGLGIVENAFDETQVVKAIPAAQIHQVEPVLLEMARRSMPRLPVDDLDVLVIDRFGKDISGAGLDTNIIGRLMIYGEAEPPAPRITAIVLGDLTPSSHGNAVGMGLADIMVRRAFDKIDYHATMENLYTSSFLARGRTPVVVESDQEALRFALRGSGVRQPSQGRVVRIQDTLHLSDILVSPTTLEEIAARDEIDVIGPLGELFDRSGSYTFGWEAGNGNS